MYKIKQNLNPFNASCSKFLLFEGFGAMLVYNPPFVSFDIRVLWRSALSHERQSTRISKITNGGLDQYGKV